MERIVSASPQEISADCQTAIREIKSLFKISANLDWHYLGLLEAVLHVYHEDYWRSERKPQAHEMDDVCRSYGVFLGEMIRKKMGRGEWKVARSDFDARWFFYLDKEHDLIDRVYQRILQGESYSLLTYVEQEFNLVVNPGKLG